MNYYTSDTHAFHERVIEYDSRPFKNAKEMTEKLADNINNVVGKKDSLYHLGDFSFGDRRDKKSQIRNARIFRDMIACKNLFLVFGNHDRHLRNNKEFRSLFTDVDNMMEFYDDIMGSWVVTCHYCLLTWNKARHGSVHLYSDFYPFVALFGHSHSNAEEMLDEKFPGRRSLDCGIDNAKKILGEYRPFSSLDIKTIMDAKPGFFEIDHHKPGKRSKA